MARVRQFANDMGMSYNQAKNLVNKGRKLIDGGTSVLEKFKMSSKKDKKDKKDKMDKREGQVLYSNKTKVKPINPVKTREMMEELKNAFDREEVKPVKPFFKVPKDLEGKEEVKPVKPSARFDGRDSFKIPKDDDAEMSEAAKKSLRLLSRSTGGGTKFGMLSVKAGIDKNPNATQADKIAGATMKNKPVRASKGRYQSQGSESRGCGAQLSGKKFKGIF